MWLASSLTTQRERGLQAPIVQPLAYKNLIHRTAITPLQSDLAMRLAAREWSKMGGDSPPDMKDYTFWRRLWVSLRLLGLRPFLFVTRLT